MAQESEQATRTPELATKDYVRAEISDLRNEIVEGFGKQNIAIAEQFGEANTAIVRGFGEANTAIAKINADNAERASALQGRLLTTIITGGILATALLGFLLRLWL